MSKEQIEMYRQLPGINWVSGYSRLGIYLDNEEIKDSPYYQSYCKMQNYFGGDNVVVLYSVPEEKWEEFFGGRQKTLDMEAFRKGEAVFVSFPVNSNGELFLDYPEEINYFQSSDIAMKKGDELTCIIHGMEIENDLLGEEKELGKISMPIGGIIFYQSDEVSGANAITRMPYGILCSEQFLKNKMRELDHTYGTENEYIYDLYYRTGMEPGYTDIYASAGLEAGYLSTDYVLAELCREHGLSLENYREQIAAHKQETLQTLLLLFFSGTCIAVVLLLIIGNSLILESRAKQRQYGILQAIGMSKRQVKKAIWREALFGSIIAVIVGWGMYGIYFSWKAVQAFQESVEAGRAFSILRYFANTEVRLSTGIFVMLGVTVAALLILILVWQSARRSLFQGSLMEKLRDSN